jgi:hypothetical protein
MAKQEQEQEQAAPEEKEAAQETLEEVRSQQSEEKADDGTTGRCQVCGEDAVYADVRPSLSPAEWCARHLPKEFAVEVAQAEQDAVPNLDAVRIDQRRQELNDLTVEDLQTRAKIEGISGRSKLDKAAVVEHLLRAEFRKGK